LEGAYLLPPDERDTERASGEAAPPAVEGADHDDAAPIEATATQTARHLMDPVPLAGEN
jgi:hypothetical protein